MSTWERIGSGIGRERHTVYWSRPRSAETGCRLAVSAYPKKWRWRVYGPNHKAPHAPEVLAEGHAASVVGGRILAERAERAVTAKKCAHGCGPLQWADDAWICPACGDEWPAE